MAGDQVGPIVGNPANRDYVRALHDWPMIAPNRVTTWHWAPYQPEWPCVFYLGDIMKYWQDCGIYGVNIQLCGENWSPLYSWLFLKLAWNPNQDANKLIRQFLEDNYGQEAAPHVWTYLKLAQGAYADSGYAPSAVRWSGWTQNAQVKTVFAVHPGRNERRDVSGLCGGGKGPELGTPGKINPSYGLID